VALDSVKAFAPTGLLHHNDAPTRWRFRPRTRPRAAGTFRQYGYAGVRVRPGLVHALTDYERIAYVRGPLLAALLIAALFALAEAATRPAALLLGGSALTLLVVPAAVSEFTWRYRVPVVVLLPPAAALGATALARRMRPWRRRDPKPTATGRRGSTLLQRAASSAPSRRARSFAHTTSGSTAAWPTHVP
jgi:hypothetical protein